MARRAMFSEPLLTVRDVAALCLVSLKTVRRWIGAGELPAHRLGSQLRVRRRDLEAFIERCRTR